MKKRTFQLTPASAGALICTIAWFSFCVFAFEPDQSIPAASSHQPHVLLWPTDTEYIGKINSPSRFALPTEEGFSGTFPESKVHLKLSLSRPEQPAIYLQNNPTPRFRPEQPHLREKISLPEPPLQMPTITQPLSIPQPDQIELFFSPDLESRINRPVKLIPSEKLSRPTLHINLRVEADGTVSSVLFEHPETDSSLAGSIRKLHFKPATRATDGWLGIRLTKKKEL